ncbi:MAG: fibronectin type III domain-containing protein, partial [Candidatus Falkowbacteria bacterium]|nr:fibronectin type III domain-containing protein [Candidatus Falkowbacteria bacterium]
MKKLNLFIFASLTFFAFGGSFSLPALAVVIGSNGFNVPSFSTATPAAVIVPVSVATASATTDLGSQYTPTSLAATAFTPTQINLSWGVVSGTDVTYQVWQSTVFNSGYAVKESDIDATATAITSLQPNTRYYFKVKACINGACSPVSELITAITLPVMPTNFRAVSVSSASQINLS